jgi:Pyruvate/2-oxoacid:ferredoxin oxidoreductase delta subunit
MYGGDVTNDIKSVVHAVASGKQAAMALDTLLREGSDAILPKLTSCAVGSGPSLSMEIYMGGERRLRSPHVVAYKEINTDYFRYSARMSQPRLIREERIRSFAEIDLRVSGNIAMRETERCFNCGLCNQCDNCHLFCPDMSVVHDQSAQGRHINYDYCKGCGLCVVECPRNAMTLEEENR